MISQIWNSLLLPPPPPTALIRVRQFEIMKKFLTHFRPMFTFYTPWKRQKTCFSDVFRRYRRTEGEHWLEKGKYQLLLRWANEKLLETNFMEKIFVNIKFIQPEYTSKEFTLIFNMVFTISLLDLMILDLMTPKLILIYV